MKITSIKLQLKRAERYSIFVDETYAFSLGADALLSSRLAQGDVVTAQQVADFARLSADDKVYNMVLRFIAIRPRSEWEIVAYLSRKDCPAPLIEQITNKLIRLALVDDAKFAEAFVRDRRLLRPTSRRKMMIELRKKHIAGDIIEAIVGNDQSDEGNALAAIVERKRKQSRYQDDLKLMQYLARQGFSYNDIKAALRIEQDD